MLRTGRTMSNGIMVAGRMVPCMELVTRSKRPGMECSIDVTSQAMHDDIWDTKISKTLDGQNISPELTWEKVDGASRYVVIMLDSGWLHMDYITTNTSMTEGEIDSEFRSNMG